MKRGRSLVKKKDYYIFYIKPINASFTRRNSLSIAYSTIGLIIIIIVEWKSSIIVILAGRKGLKIGFIIVIIEG